MKRKLHFNRIAFGAILLVFVSPFCFSQSGPEVLKVEPPNWWAGHSINPVRVMIRGRNLAGARVEAIGAGIRSGLTRINETGTYLFVDVTIDEKAQPGSRRLRVTTSGGTTGSGF